MTTESHSHDRAPDVRRSRAGRLAPLALVLLAVAVAGCGSGGSTAKSDSGGSSSGTSNAANSTPQPSPQEQSYDAAVLQMAQEVYRQQNIVSATCHKVGFTPSGDVASCTLTSSDGSATTPSNWNLFQDGQGGYHASPPSSGPSSQPAGSDQPGCIDANGDNVC